MNANPGYFERHRLSVDDYHRMSEAGILAPDARVELINGEIIDMAPIGPMHLGITDQLTQTFVMALGKRAIVRTQGSVVLENFSEPEPDLLLLRPRKDFYKHAVAGPADVLLLIEVSESSLRYDTNVKLPLYASTGIPEVWIVDIKAGRLRRFAEPVDAQWQFEDSPDALDAVVPQLCPDVSLDLTDLFE